MSAKTYVLFLLYFQMSSPVLVRLLGLVLLLLFTLTNLVPAVSSMALIDFCGLGSELCRKNVDIVHPYIAEVCEACGNFWENVPGFAYCCRCDDKIFAFCMEAVEGGKR